MRHLTNTFIIGSVLCLAIALGSCNRATDNSEAEMTAEEKAKATLDSARDAAQADWQQFKEESDTAIAGLEEKVKALEEKISTTAKEEKKELKEELANAKEKLNGLKQHLNEKNTEFKRDMGDFSDSVAEKSASFKREFKHDMESLRKSLKDLVTDNEEE